MSLERSSVITEFVLSNASFWSSIIWSCGFSPLLVDAAFVAILCCVVRCLEFQNRLEVFSDLSVDLCPRGPNASPLYTNLAVRSHLRTVIPRTLKRHYLLIPQYPALFVGNVYLMQSTLQCMEGYDRPTCVLWFWAQAEILVDVLAVPPSARQ